MSAFEQILAAQIRKAQTSTPPSLLTRACAGLSLDQAYEVQQEAAILRLSRGEEHIGYKIGCTSKATQTQLGINEPIFGRLFTSDRFESPHTVSRGDFAELAVEGEIAVELKCDPRDLPDSQLKISQAISRIIAVIELHHFRIPPERRTAPILVAHNAIHAGFVQSRRNAKSLIKNSGYLMIVIDEIPVAMVKCKDLEKQMFESLTWLRTALHARDQMQKLDPPVTVLCGSLAELLPIEKACEVSVSWGGLPTVDCRVA